MQDKIKKIKLLCFDCDGVLSDGRIIYIQTADNQVFEQKNFSAKDGMGLMMANRAGLISAVITGRTSLVLAQRCKDLRIEHLYQNIDNKAKKMEELLAELQLSWENVAYMGDDWNDFPIFRRAGFAGAPSDGDDAIKPFVDYVTKKKGGKGAVREFIDLILKEQGLYEKSVEKFNF
ncbi:MAG: HAD hydrolase family protein [Candidatus Cloacimonadales bacterium]